MQIIKGKERVAEICFYIGIALQITVMVFAQTAVVLPFASRFLHVAFAFFCLKIIGTYYTRIEWVCMILLGILGVASYLAIGDEKALCIMVTIFAVKQIDLMKIVRILFWTLLITCVFTMFLSLLGWGEQLLDIRSYGRGSIESRWGFGLGHANNFHGMFWYLMSLLFLGYYKVLTPKQYALLSFLNIAFFVVTASRTGFLLAQVVIIVGWLLYYDVQWIQKTWVYILSYVGVFGLTIVTIIACTFGMEVHPIMGTLNSVLSGRLEFASWWAKSADWRLLDAMGPSRLIDNGIARLFASNGYIIAIVYLGVTILLIAYFQKNRSKVHFVYLVVLMCNFLYVFMEATFSLNTNILINLFYMILMITWTKLLPWNKKGTYDRS